MDFHNTSVESIYGKNSAKALKKEIKQYLSNSNLKEKANAKILLQRILDHQFPKLEEPVWTADMSKVSINEEQTQVL
mgnify:CR=1 FL=1